MMIEDDSDDREERFSSWTTTPIWRSPCGRSLKPRAQRRVATDGVQALELAGRGRPDVAILDIELPVMNGYELALHLRALPQMDSCLLIAVTGYGQAHDERQSRESASSITSSSRSTWISF